MFIKPKGLDCYCKKKEKEWVLGGLDVKQEKI